MRPAQEPIASGPGTGVAPSPFNEVKLELVIAGLLGTLLWLAADLFTLDLLHQLLLLFGYGALAALWLAMRVRRILGTQLASTQPPHGPQQN